MALIKELRDELKGAQDIVIILSGTNSKAANMIGITTSKYSFSNIKTSGEKWSCLVTRMPKFFIELSQYFAFSSWSNVQATASNHEIRRVMDAILISIRGNGNPRLINLAISALERVHGEATPDDPFTSAKWQETFSMTNIIKGKFALAKLSNGVEILKAQANLLLVASSYSLLADAAIRRHYGQRAFPDNGVNSCSSFNDSMSVYGGWLKLCPPQWRCMGKVLHCGEIDSSRITRSHVDWQASVFQPVRNDILLYLASCWSTGFSLCFIFKPAKVRMLLLK